MIAIHLISLEQFGVRLHVIVAKNSYDMCTVENVEMKPRCTINVLSVSVSIQWILFIFLFHVIANCTIEFIRFVRGDSDRVWDNGKFETATENSSFCVGDIFLLLLSFFVSHFIFFAQIYLYLYIVGSSHVSLLATLIHRTVCMLIFMCICCVGSIRFGTRNEFNVSAVHECKPDK